MAGVAVAQRAEWGPGHRDGGAIRIPVTAAAAVDPSDGDRVVLALCDRVVLGDDRTWFARDVLAPCDDDVLAPCDDVVLGLDADAGRREVRSRPPAALPALPTPHRYPRRTRTESGQPQKSVRYSRGYERGTDS